MAIIANRPSQQMVDLVGALGGEWHGNVATCRCPAHTDKTPSLSIRQGDRGLLVTCFAGCDAADILRELARIPLGRRYTPPFKGHASPISVAPIREIAGVCSKERVRPVVFAVNGFTKAARETARQLAVTLVDAPRLAALAKANRITDL